MYISSFLQLWTKNKSKNIQKSKKSKKSKVIFSDFYCLINTKFWITNEKMFIKKKSFLVMSIASFLQLWTTNNWKTLKNQKSQKSKKSF